MRLLLCLLFMFGSIVSPGQVSFLAKTIDFRDSANAARAHDHADRLGSVLLDGYLKGKLRGYQVEIKETVLKRAPLSAERKPKTWERGFDYYPGDEVEYKGFFYRTDTEPNSFLDPEKSKSWYKIEILGDPVSVRYDFPVLADTLSKTKFLEQMIEYMPERLDRWRPDYTYYPMERVDFNGFTFEATREMKAIPPLPENDAWERIWNGIYFFHPSSFTAARIVYAVERAIWAPQLITPLVRDQNSGILRSVGVSFYVEDAVDYLNSIQQPVLLLSDLGYRSHSHWMLDGESKPVVLGAIQTGLRDKEIKLKKKKLLDAEVYSSFLNDDSLSRIDSPWRIFQDLSTLELCVGQQRMAYDSYDVVPAFRIPLNEFETLVPTRAVRSVMSYADVLSDQNWSGQLDTLAADSLAPLVPRMAHQQPGSTYRFLEQYRAKVSAINQLLEKAMPIVWNYLEQAFYAKQLFLKHPIGTKFDHKYDWSHTKLEAGGREWVLAEGFSLGVQELVTADSLKIPDAFIELWVTYEQQFSEQASQLAMKPIEITILVRSNEFDDGGLIGYTVGWNSFKQALIHADDAAVRQWVQSVDRGSFKFYDAEVVYGLFVNR